MLKMHQIKQFIIDSSIKDETHEQSTQRAQSTLFQKVQQLELQNEMFKKQILLLQQQKSKDDLVIKGQLNTMEQEIKKLRQPYSYIHKHSATETKNLPKSHKKLSEDLDYYRKVPSVHQVTQDVHSVTPNPIQLDRDLQKELHKFFSMSKETPIIKTLCTGCFVSYEQAIVHLNKRSYDLLLAELLPIFNKLIDGLRNLPVPKASLELSGVQNNDYFRSIHRITESRQSPIKIIKSTTQGCEINEEYNIMRVKPTNSLVNFTEQQIKSYPYSTSSQVSYREIIQSSREIQLLLDSIKQNNVVQE